MYDNVFIAVPTITNICFDAKQINTYLSQLAQPKAHYSYQALAHRLQLEVRSLIRLYFSQLQKHFVKGDLSTLVVAMTNWPGTAELRKLDTK
jgi:hypothetical protein